MSKIILEFVDGLKHFADMVKSSVTATPPTLENGDLAFTELDGCLHYKDSSGVVRQTPLANKFTWPPNILEDIEISFTASQISVSTGNVTLKSLSGERRLVRVIGALTDNPSLASDEWRFIWVVIVPTGNSAYVTTTSDRAGTGINTTHLRDCIGACQILGGVIASVYSGNPDNPNSPLRIKAPHAIAKSREGLLMTRISGTQIEVGSGACTVDLGSDRYLVELSASTKTVDVSTNVWRYVFVTYHPATDVIDWAVDTSSIGANISASLAKRLIGTYQVVAGAVDEFINREPGYFELTTNSADRLQVWGIPTTATLYTVPVPPILCKAEFIFSSGLPPSNTSLALRFSSPDNQLSIAGDDTSSSGFNSDIATYYSTTAALSELGNSTYKPIITNTGQILAQRVGDYLGTEYHSVCQALSYQLINI